MAMNMRQPLFQSILTAKFYKNIFKDYKDIGELFGYAGKNSLFLVLAHFLNAFSSFIVGILIARWLGVSFFGEYVVAYNFYSLFCFFPLLGLGTFVIREMAKDKTSINKYFVNIGFITIIAAIACLLLICAILPFTKYGMTTKIATYIVSLSLFPNSLILVTHLIFITLGKVRYAFFAAILEVSVKLILTVIALTLGQGINVLMAIFFISKFAGLALSIYFVKRIIGSFRTGIDLVFCRKIFKEFAFIFAFITILSSIFTKIDVIVLSNIRQITEVGWYGPVAKTWIGYTFIMAIATVFLPILAKLFSASPELFEATSRQFFKYLVAMLLPLLLIGFLAAEQIILFCFGPGFLNSVAAFKIIIWAVFFLGLYGICEHILIIGNKQVLAVYALGFSLIVSLGLNICFSYWWGYIGTSIAVLISAGIAAMSGCMLVNKFMFKLHLFSVLSKPLLSMAIVVIFIFLVKQNMNLSLLIILSVLIYFSVLLGLGLFTKEDIGFFKKLRKYISTSDVNAIYQDEAG